MTSTPTSSGLLKQPDKQERATADDKPRVAEHVGNAPKDAVSIGVPGTVRERDEFPDGAGTDQRLQSLERLGLRAEDEPGQILRCVQLGPIAGDVDGGRAQPVVEQKPDERGKASLVAEFVRFDNRLGLSDRPCREFHQADELRRGRVVVDVAANVDGPLTIVADLFSRVQLGRIPSVEAHAEPGVDSQDQIGLGLLHPPNGSGPKHDVGITNVRRMPRLQWRRGKRFDRAGFLPSRIEHEADVGILLDDGVGHVSANEVHFGRLQHGECG